MKNFRLLALLCVLAIGFTSCKEQQNEWRNFSGYTSQDVIGTYSVSNEVSAFEGLTEGSYCHICRDAQVAISSTGNKLKIEVKSNSTGLNWSEVGNPCLNNGDFMMQLGNAPELDFLATVYTNDNNGIRLHGYVRRNHITYYFDVIKN